MILPAKADRGIVVFWLFPSLLYETRLVVGFGLIVLGAALQFLTVALMLGLVGIVAGNALLLAKGYDNRVDAGGFDPDAHWERVDMEKLQELKDLDRRMRKWDRSAIDVTNWLGAVTFVLVAGGLVAAAVVQSGPLRIVAIDGLALFVPHWITGTRSILRKPGLLVRIGAIEEVLNRARRRLADHQLSFMMLISGGDPPVPSDVKFKVDVAGHHPDFLGLYGQVVINEVQGTSYPYFYVVLVARKGFGLRDVFHGYRTSREITKEFKRQDEVEVFVIRQHTTDESGYHTGPAEAATILFEGLKVSERVAGGAVPSSPPG